MICAEIFMKNNDWTRREMFLLSREIISFLRCIRKISSPWSISVKVEYIEKLFESLDVIDQILVWNSITKGKRIDYCRSHCFVKIPICYLLLFY